MKGTHAHAYVTSFTGLDELQTRKLKRFQPGPRSGDETNEEKTNEEDEENKEETEKEEDNENEKDEEENEEENEVNGKENNEEDGKTEKEEKVQFLNPPNSSCIYLIYSHFLQDFVEMCQRWRTKLGDIMNILARKFCILFLFTFKTKYD